MLLLQITLTLEQVDLADFFFSLRMKQLTFATEFSHCSLLIPTKKNSMLMSNM